MKHTYTHKTRDGRHKARILATDLLGDTPVAVALLNKDHTECVVLYNADLLCYDSGPGFDLVELNSWEDVAVDTKILVRDWDDQEWYHRYFSHYDNGQVYAFDSGATSWSSSKLNTVEWKQAKLAE